MVAQVRPGAQSAARCATASTGRSVVSSRWRASSRRCAVNHAPGDSPVSSRNRRLNVRSLIRARRASRATSTALGQVLAAPTPAHRPSSHRRRTAPDDRCTAPDRRRAMAARRSAARLHWRRLHRDRGGRCAGTDRCPRRGPADVSRSPSSTKSTFSSRSTCGYSRRKSSAYDQWVVAGRPSSNPAAASTNAPGADRHEPGRRDGCGRARCAAARRARLVARAGHPRTRARPRCRRGRAARLPRAARARSPRLVVVAAPSIGAHPHVVERSPGRVARLAEHHRSDRGVEADDGCDGKDDNAMGHGRIVAHSGAPATGRARCRDRQTWRVLDTPAPVTRARSARCTAPGSSPRSRSRRCSALPRSARRRAC